MIIEKIKSSSLAEIIGAITTILFVIGASYKYGFYSSNGINGQWLVQVFSPVELLFANLKLAIFYLTAMIYLDYLFSQKKSTKNTLILGSITIISTGIGIYITSGDYYQWLGILIVFYALVAVLKSDYFGKLAGITTLLVLMPFGKGVYDLKSDLDKNKFPKASVLNDMKEWELIELFSDKAILFNRANKEFKIVEMKEIELIKTSK